MGPFQALHVPESYEQDDINRVLGVEREVVVRTRARAGGSPGYLPVLRRSVRAVDRRHGFIDGSPTASSLTLRDAAIMFQKRRRIPPVGNVVETVA